MREKKLLLAIFLCFFVLLACSSVTMSIMVVNVKMFSSVTNIVCANLVRCVWPVLGYGCMKLFKAIKPGEQFRLLRASRVSECFVSNCEGRIHSSLSCTFHTDVSSIAICLSLQKKIKRKTKNTTQISNRISGRFDVLWRRRWMLKNCQDFFPFQFNWYKN